MAIALQKNAGVNLSRETRTLELLKRPEITYHLLMTIEQIGPGCTNSQVSEQVEIQAKYAGYIDRQAAEIDRFRRYESLIIPEAIDYTNVSGLSTEVKQKLLAAKPETIGAASRVQGSHLRLYLYYWCI